MSGVQWSSMKINLNNSFVEQLRDIWNIDFKSLGFETLNQSLLDLLLLLFLLLFDHIVFFDELIFHPFKNSCFLLNNVCFWLNILAWSVIIQILWSCFFLKSLSFLFSLKSTFSEKAHFIGVVFALFVDFVKYLFYLVFWLSLQSFSFELSSIIFVFSSAIKNCFHISFHLLNSVDLHFGCVFLSSLLILLILDLLFS